MALYLDSYTQQTLKRNNTWYLYGSPLFDYGNRFQLKELEDDKGYEISLELPGYKASQLEVEVVEDTLCVRAKSDNRSVSQSVILPTALDTKRASAKLEDGILTITFGLAEEKKPHRIEIK